LRRIYDNFDILYPANPHFPQQQIIISHAEFDATLEKLAMADIPIKPDREKAWMDFAGWRVNYDEVLLALCDLTMAPVAPWSSDQVVMGKHTLAILPRRQR